jgi:hypothetical protein
LHTPLLLAAGIMIGSCGRTVRRQATAVVRGQPRQLTAATALAVVSEGCWRVVKRRRHSHAIGRRRRAKPVLLLLRLLQRRLCATAAITLLQQTLTRCLERVMYYPNITEVWMGRLRWPQLTTFGVCKVKGRRTIKCMALME